MSLLLLLRSAVSSITSTVAVGSETSTDATADERLSASVASAGETAGAAVGAERYSAAVASAGETSVAATDSEDISVTVASAGETTVDAVGLVTNPGSPPTITCTVDVGSEAAVDATLSQTEPTPTPPTPSIGGSGGGGPRRGPAFHPKDFAYKYLQPIKRVDVAGETSTDAVAGVRYVATVASGSETSAAAVASVRRIRISATVAVGSSSSVDAAAETAEAPWSVEEEDFVLLAAYDLMEVG